MTCQCRQILRSRPPPVHAQDKLDRLVSMNRRALAFAVVLLIAGLAPATAIIGFCARMSCCRQAAENTASLGAETRDCCTTLACYESPAARLTSTFALAAALVVTPATPVLAPAVPVQTLVDSARSDRSPPPDIGVRLAVLSTLLI